MQSGGRMGQGRGKRILWMGVVAAVACAIGVRAQVVARPNGESHAVDSSQRILRQVIDPHTGQRWLLVADEENPAGPGRLVMASGFAAHAGGRNSALAVHAGDKIVVEEHGAAVDAYLEASALEPAAVGSRFNARLKIGGKVVKAIALGPGRAEVRP